MNLRYAQIKGGVVVNVIVIGDGVETSPFAEGFDAFVRIDTLLTVPGIGWGYDVETRAFTAPVYEE